jgi:hypothetical protein
MEMGSGGSISEFELLLAERNHAWSDLRERLARAARELHFAGVASQTQEGAALLAIATSLAGLAMSIPMPVAHGLGGPVEASTLFATQILQRAQMETAP